MTVSQASALIGPSHLLPLLHEPQGLLSWAPSWAVNPLGEGLVSYVCLHPSARHMAEPGDSHQRSVLN